MCSKRYACVCMFLSFYTLISYTKYSFASFKKITVKWSFSWVIQILCKKAFRNTKDRKDIGDQLCNTSIFSWINCGSDRGNVVPKVTQPGNVGYIDTQWSEGWGRPRRSLVALQGLGLSFAGIPCARVCMPTKNSRT